MRSCTWTRADLVQSIKLAEAIMGRAPSACVTTLRSPRARADVTERVERARAVRPEG